MKQLHKVLINVFCKEREDESLILEKLKSLIPLDLEKEKIYVKRTSAEGFSNKKIRIFEIELKKEAHTNGFLDDFLGKLSDEQKEMLHRQAESRLDDNLDFFIRLDKEKLLNNEFFITHSGNCFHIKLHIAAFPAKKAVALDIVKKILKPKT